MFSILQALDMSVFHSAGGEGKIAENFLGEGMEMSCKSSEIIRF